MTFNGSWIPWECNSQLLMVVARFCQFTGWAIRGYMKHIVRILRILKDNQAKLRYRGLLIFLTFSTPQLRHDPYTEILNIQERIQKKYFKLFFQPAWVLCPRRLGLVGKIRGQKWNNGRLACKKCMTGRRARELFDALDDDGNGVLTEEEFVQVQL